MVWTGRPGRYPARATEIAPAVQAAFLDFYFDVCKADVVDIDLLAIGDRNLVEPGPQRRQIVIGELGVDGPREFHARSAPESPVDRSANLQPLLVGQDRFPTGALAGAAAPAAPHASVPAITFPAKSRRLRRVQPSPAEA